jgi:23S rRNA (uracil1939-C5)-methyltransferase
VLTLDVDSLAYGGKESRGETGTVVFVAGGLPGDRVKAEVTRAKRGYAEASAIEVVRQSPIAFHLAAITEASPPAPPGRASRTPSSSAISGSR